MDAKHSHTRSAVGHGRVQPLALAVAASGIDVGALTSKRAKLRFRYEIQSGSCHEDDVVLAPKDPGG